MTPKESEPVTRGPNGDPGDELHAEPSDEESPRRSRSASERGTGSPGRGGRSIGPHRETLLEMAPSPKLVAKVLELRGELDHPGIVEETLLPPRTVRYAVARLEDEGVVDSRVDVTDARKQIYFLAE